MVEYIKNIVPNFPEEIIQIPTSPAADHLFMVQDKPMAKPLPEEQTIAFHHAIMRLLFLKARARCIIRMATAFLTTRINNQDEDN